METRKRLRLPEYDYAKPGAYFVTICTHPRRPLFGTVVGADVPIGPHVALSHCGGVVDGCIGEMPSVATHIVMPDHVHLLVRLEAGATLPMVIRWLKRETARRCGTPLWQRGYYDHIIRSETDFLETWTYIQANPTRWAETHIPKGGLP